MERHQFHLSDVIYPCTTHHTASQTWRPSKTWSFPLLRFLSCGLWELIIRKDTHFWSATVIICTIHISTAEPNDVCTHTDRPVTTHCFHDWLSRVVNIKSLFLKVGRSPTPIVTRDTPLASHGVRSHGACQTTNHVLCVLA